MEWERRPRRATPEMTQREFEDDRGRRWVGSVTSGTQAGGEEHAEVFFVCRDQPAELKRVARLDVPAEEAGERWLVMDETEVRETFRRSDPA